MNLEPPLPPPRLSSCHLHPHQHVTGFCASCLRERLSGLDPASHRKPNPSSSALKSIFKVDSARVRASASTSKCVLPELRRTKSFSGAKADGIPVIFEPQRKSCDVRVRNTLWSLFHQDIDNKCGTTICGEIEEPNARNINLGFDEVKDEGEGEIRVLETEIRVEESVGAEEDVRTMKDHIDLDAQMKNQGVEKRDLKEIAGSFWLAASVFSKKLQKWRRKKKRSGRESAARSARVQRPALSSRRFRETQSEVADYGYGRRSCDTDPRFSLDAGRISFDDSRYSFDEPRASWDGYLIGRAAAALPRMPTMGSVVEDVPALVRRWDNQIPVEEPMNSIEEHPTTPGGSTQAREYYSESSSSQRRRRQDLKRSISIGKVGVTSTVGDETKWVSNSKVSPESMDYYPVNKIADTKDLKSNSLRDNCSESFESAYKDASAIAGRGGLRKCSKKSRRWTRVWNIWGLMQRRGSSKDDDFDKYSRGNVVERSFSESWPEIRREVNGMNGDQKGTFNRKMFRSNSSVSSRSSLGTFGGIRSSKEANGHSKKRMEEFAIERNRSARFSPSHFDNGLLRFYLTPLRRSWRSGDYGKSRSKSSHSFTRSMLRLY